MDDEALLAHAREQVRVAVEHEVAHLSGYERWSSGGPSGAARVDSLALALLDAQGPWHVGHASRAAGLLTCSVLTAYRAQQVAAALTAQTAPGPMVTAAGVVIVSRVRREEARVRDVWWTIEWLLAAEATPEPVRSALLVHTVAS